MKWLPYRCRKSSNDAWAPPRHPRVAPKMDSVSEEFAVERHLHERIRTAVSVDRRHPRRCRAQATTQSHHPQARTIAHTPPSHQDNLESRATISTGPAENQQPPLSAPSPNKWGSQVLAND